MAYALACVSIVAASFSKVREAADEPRVTLSFKQAIVAAAVNRLSDVGLEQFAKERGVGYSTLQKWLRLAGDEKALAVARYPD